MATASAPGSPSSADGSPAQALDEVPDELVREKGRRFAAEDIVDEWGRQSFPASDPPANW